MNSSATLLATITDMQTRLMEMQQQLTGHNVQNGQNVHNGQRGRVPYSYRNQFVESSGPASNTSIRLQHAHAHSQPQPQSADSRPRAYSYSQSHLQSDDSRAYSHSQSDDSRPRPRARTHSQSQSQSQSDDSHPRPRAHSHSQSDNSRPRPQRAPRNQAESDLPLPRSQQPRSYPQQQQRSYQSQGRFQVEDAQEVRFETVSLSSVLENNEEVTFRVIIKKDEAGQPVYTTVVASFDGVNLTVLSSELVPQLVGVQSSKPGEILYQFIDALKEQGHLKRSFTIAPWKLCSAMRDGQAITLEALRRQYLATKQMTLATGATVATVATVATLATGATGATMATGATE